MTTKSISKSKARTKQPCYEVKTRNTPSPRELTFHLMWHQSITCAPPATCITSYALCKQDRRLSASRYHVKNRVFIYDSSPAPTFEFHFLKPSAPSSLMSRLTSCNFISSGNSIFHCSLCECVRKKKAKINKKRRRDVLHFLFFFQLILFSARSVSRLSNSVRRFIKTANYKSRIPVAAFNFTAFVYVLRHRHISFVYIFFSP